MASFLAQRLIPLGLGTFVGGGTMFAMRPTNKNNARITKGGLFVSNGDLKVKITDTEFTASDGKIQVKMTDEGLKIYKIDEKHKKSWFGKPSPGDVKV